MDNNFDRVEASRRIREAEQELNRSFPADKELPEHLWRAREILWAVSFHISYPGFNQNYREGISTVDCMTYVHATIGHEAGACIDYTTYGNHFTMNLYDNSVTGEPRPNGARIEMWAE